MFDIGEEVKEADKNIRAIGEAHINQAIVERLKKLIEEMDVHGDVPKSWVKDVLKRKIIGDV